MKKSLLLLALCLSLFSCRAQEAIKPVFPQGDMKVLSIISGTATIKSPLTEHSFIIDAPKDLVAEWVYFFALETTNDSEGKMTRHATVRFHHITPEQAAKNIAKGLADFKAANPKQ